MGVGVRMYIPCYIKHYYSNVQIHPCDGCGCPHVYIILYKESIYSVQLMFAEYSLFDRNLLQKRPMISSILLTEAL